MVVSRCRILDSDAQVCIKTLAGELIDLQGILLGAKERSGIEGQEGVYLHRPFSFVLQKALSQSTRYHLYQQGVLSMGMACPSGAKERNLTLSRLRIQRTTLHHRRNKYMRLRRSRPKSSHAVLLREETGVRELGNWVQGWEPQCSRNIHDILDGGAGDETGCKLSQTNPPRKAQGMRSGHVQ